MARPINPYIAGNPIRDPSGFFGRQDLIEWVSKELENPGTSALVLFGQRRIGKTTVLFQLKHSLPQSEYCTILFDLQDQARRTLRQVLIDLAEVMAEAVDMELPPLDLFDATGRFFRQVFIPDFLERAGINRRVVLLFDEFDVLSRNSETLPEDIAADRLFPFLRRLMEEHQGLALVFVAGRNPEELSHKLSSIFKTSIAKEVWVLDEVSALDLVLQAKKNETLKFSENAVERIIELTHCHPFLIQLLCQRIWQKKYSIPQNEIPLVDLVDVDTSIGDALQSGNAAFEWLWEGLLPAEQVYAAAFAEVTKGNEPINENDVIQVLSAHASRLRNRSVELAPKDLVTRRILENAGEQQYLFAVELLRLWVKENRPLKMVKDKLDEIDQPADKLFAVGLSFYQRNQWDEAKINFQSAIGQNPNHFKAHLFLGETLLNLGKLEDSVKILRQAYQLDKAEARYPLARVLVVQAEEAYKKGREEDALIMCSNILELSPNEESAKNLTALIWTKRGDKFLENKLWQQATEAYTKANNSAKLERVRQKEINEAELLSRFVKGQAEFKKRNWDQAIDHLKWVVNLEPFFEKEGVLAVAILGEAVNRKKHSLRKHPTAIKYYLVIVIVSTILLISFIFLFSISKREIVTRLILGTYTPATTLAATVDFLPTPVISSTPILEFIPTFDSSSTPEFLILSTPTLEFIPTSDSSSTPEVPYLSTPTP